MMWRDKLNELKKLISKYDLKLEPSIDKDLLDSLFDSFNKSYNCDLPSEYKEFLLETNGIEFNGCYICGLGYDKDNYISIEYNTDMIRYNSNMVGYVMFGSANLSWFLMSENNQFIEVDHSGEIINQFDGFNDLLLCILNEMIGL